MTKEERLELKIEVAEFVGFRWVQGTKPVPSMVGAHAIYGRTNVEWYWIDPNGDKCEPPDFTHEIWGIAHFFQWVKPILEEKGYEIIVRFFEGMCRVTLFAGKKPDKDSEAIDKEPQIAFCLACRSLGVGRLAVRELKKEASGE